jgi:anaerobic dimethyl sulfoxide reductase subunit A
MTGNVGITGGGAGLLPFWGGMYFPITGIPIPENPVKATIPCFIWPDYITKASEMSSKLEEGALRGADKLASSMKFMWNHAGNTLINQHTDINLTTKILQDETMLEFIVTSEVAMTPSCMFSDILLPETTGFEAEEIITGDSKAGGYAWALFNHQIIEPMFECKGILWIAEQVADRIGIGEQFREGHQTREDWMRDMVASAQQSIPDFPSLEDFRKVGIYRLRGSGPTVAFAEFRADPVANPLWTETGKIEIYSPTLAKFNNTEIPAIPMYIPEWEGVGDPLREKYPLMMMTTHFVARSHSTFDNVDYLREAHPQAIWINTNDAKSRGIKNGDLVRVFNDRGEVHLPAYVTNRIRPGTTDMPQGAWYTPNADGVDIRGCGNTLTNYRPTPFAKGVACHTSLVQVEKL